MLDVATGTLATYIKLSVLGLTMATQLETYGLSEDQIGERIYRTADAYFRLSTVRRRIQRTTTLGNNGPKCDFRFSKAGAIVEGWPPGQLQEFRISQ